MNLSLNHISVTLIFTLITATLRNITDNSLGFNSTRTLFRNRVLVLDYSCRNDGWNCSHKRQLALIGSERCADSAGVSAWGKSRTAFPRSHKDKTHVTPHQVHDEEGKWSAKLTLEGQERWRWFCRSI